MLSAIINGKIVEKNAGITNLSTNVLSVFLALSTSPSSRGSEADMVIQVVFLDGHAFGLAMTEIIEYEKYYY
jgi:hypothetical protein